MKPETKARVEAIFMKAIRDIGKLSVDDDEDVEHIGAVMSVADEALSIIIDNAYTSSFEQLRTLAGFDLVERFSRCRRDGGVCLLGAPPRKMKRRRGGAGSA